MLRFLLRLLARRRRSVQAARPPVALEPVRLFASAFGWVAGLCWIGLAIAIPVGLSAAGVAAATTAAGNRVVMVGGVILATPGALMLSWVMLVAAVHLLQARDGAIVFDEARLVIHDRWMLSQPMSIDRCDISGIERLPRLGVFEYSAFGGKAGFELGASGALLDWGTRPNFRIELVRQRQFVEAIRTLPSRTPLQPISKYQSGGAILIRVVDADHASAQFEQWLYQSESRRRRIGSQSPRHTDPLHFGWLMVVLYVGFAMFCLGSLL